MTDTANAGDVAGAPARPKRTRAEKLRRRASSTKFYAGGNIAALVLSTIAAIGWAATGTDGENGVFLMLGGFFPPVIGTIWFPLVGVVVAVVIVTVTAFSAAIVSDDDDPFRRAWFAHVSAAAFYAGLSFPLAGIALLALFAATFRV